MTKTGANNLRNRKGVKEKSQSSSAAAAGDDDVALTSNNTDKTSGGNNDMQTAVTTKTEAYQVLPLTERSSLTRLDVGPFALLYIILILADNYGVVESDRWLITVCLGGTLVAHLIVVLLCQWNVLVQATVGYHFTTTSVATNGTKNTLKQQQRPGWTHALVQPTVHDSSIKGGIELVEYQNEDNDRVIAQVTYHDTRFRCCCSGKNGQGDDLDVTLWEPETTQKESSGVSKQQTATAQSSFRSLRYPTDWLISRYLSWPGHVSLVSATQAGRVYGPNAILLALPTFGELLQTQLVAPFFLFQVFCVVLWSLDEYWYYAMFTLVALLVFESTVAYNRLQSLQRLRHAGSAGNNNNNNNVQRVWVFRGFGMGGVTGGHAQQWMHIPTQELVPGDLVSLAVSPFLQHNSGDSSPTTRVPADIVLVEPGSSAVCDEALLTGESVPQLKQPLVDASVSSVRFDMQDPVCQESILFGGTNLIVATPAEEERHTNRPPPPDGGVVGFVLRTGFGTAQGNLLRTMAHSSHTADSVHTRDTFYFIAALIVCAMIAASWVLMDGWNDPRRNRFRLVLHVVIIVTSVVPPELPMELSLALTNSVAALAHRCQVYCTELHRIPWAGQVNVCCFDKTGTLTSDEMCLRGVRLFSSTSDSSSSGLTLEEHALVQPSSGDIPWEVTRVMAACQALALAGVRRRNQNSSPRMIGDPLERAVLKESGFVLESNNTVHNEATGESLSILHRFPFTSKLKRMTVLAVEEERSSTSSNSKSKNSNNVVWALTKGAPETIKALLKHDSIPPNFDDVSFHHMSHGRRVLAMAYRQVGTADNVQVLKDMGRDAVESNLLFAGFLVLDCPLKLDSGKVIRELVASGHRPVMITGDSLLTASEVARQVGIIDTSSTSIPNDDSVYQIREKDNANGANSPKSDILACFECVKLKTKVEDNDEVLPLSKEGLLNILEQVALKKKAFCLAGDVLTKIALAAQHADISTGSSLNMSTADEKQILLHPSTQMVLTRLVPFISVFARHTPHQKEAVVAALNHGGAYTMYAGDGVNDVGALKRAHVGISILSAPEVESKQRKVTKKMAKLRKNAKKGRATRDSASAWEDSIKQLKEAQEEITEVELGDASVAAPFTSRAVSIKCCKDVILQGRCTLVTMLQIYKILGINCLVNAMVLSRLFLNGVKQGDRQLTILGVVVAALFFFVTRGEPLPELSATRPPVSVLCLQALLSIVVQFIVHVGAILIAAETALMFADPYDPSLVPDGPFNPNTLNTCTFLLTCLSTVNTFASNYRGRPFLKDLKENKALYRSLLVCYGCLAVCTLEVFLPLNDLMQLTALPEANEQIFSESETVFVDAIAVVGFPAFMAALMIADTVLVIQAEAMILRYVG